MSRPLILLLSLALAACEAGKPAGDAPDDTSTPDTATPDTADTAAPVEPGIFFLETPTPIDLSPDGRTALLWDNLTEAGNAFVFDIPSGSGALATAVGDASRNFPSGLSTSLHISAVHGSPAQAGVWSQERGWVELVSPYAEGCGADVAGAWDISADGAVLVGAVWNGCRREAFRWTEASGSDEIVPLAVIGSADPPANQAFVVSDDGTVTGGFAQTALAERWPAVWDATGAGTLLPAGVFPEDTVGEVLAVSAGGTRVAGTWGTDAFYWSAAEGVVNIGKLADALDTDVTHANTLAADGALILGACGDPFAGIPRAFVWTEAGGMRVLADVLGAAGVVLPEGYVLTNVVAASADGTVVLGAAVDGERVQHSFVATLPVSAYGL